MNLGSSEILLVLFIALLLFGGKRLPELARNIGKGLAQFRRAAQQVQQEIHSPLSDITAVTKPAPPPSSAALESEQNKPTVHAHPAAQSRTPETPPGTNS